jgi:PKD repeat protein
MYREVSILKLRVAYPDVRAMRAWRLSVTGWAGRSAITLLVLTMLLTVGALPNSAAGPKTWSAPRAVGPSLELRDAPSGSSGSAALWQNITRPGLAPPGRNRAVFVNDPASQEVLLFGGYQAGGLGWLGDTWVTSAGNWTELSPAMTPGPRSSAAAAYDPSLLGVVVFGGYNYNSASPYMNDTWLFKDGNWTPLPTSVAPSVRSESAMAYDPSLGELVLFGGRDSSGYLNDTWVYGASGWSQLSVSQAPPPLSGGAMAFDANISELVLYGGGNATENFNATWTLNDIAWSPLVTPFSPGGQYLVSMTTLPNGTVLLCGTLNGTSLTPPIVAWEISGGGWVPVGGDSGPSSRAGAAMTYDSTDGYALLFGGRYFYGGAGEESLNDSWAFDTMSAHLLPFASTGFAPFALTPAANVTAGPLTSEGASTLTYLWSFGDGASSTVVSPEHTYNLAGVYDLELTVRDEFGLNVTLSTGVVVDFHLTIGIAPVAASGQTYQFSVTSPNTTGPLFLTWEFGDGSTSTVPTPEHTYATSGPFTVSVQAADAEGAKGLASRSFTVPPPLSAHADAPTTAHDGVAVAFAGSASGGAGAYVFTWTFGDGTSGTGQYVNHTYPAATHGNLSGNLNVRDANGTEVNVSFVVNVSATSSVLPNPSPGQNSTGRGSGNSLSVLDYVLIGAAIAAVAAVACAMVLRRRRPPTKP